MAAHDHICDCGAIVTCTQEPCQRTGDEFCPACETHGRCEECGKPNRPNGFLCPEHQDAANEAAA